MDNMLVWIMFGHGKCVGMASIGTKSCYLAMTPLFCRRECYIYSSEKHSWKMVEEPAPAGLAFSGMSAGGSCVYVVGGRENLYTADGLDRTWKHSGAVMEYCTTRKGINAWRFLANLTNPVSDGCAAVVDGRLWLVGGEQEVSLLGPAQKKWKENIADEPIDIELANMALKPGKE